MRENIDEYDLGDMNEICPYSQARFFSCEKSNDGKFSICCQKGKVDLSTRDERNNKIYQPKPPQYLQKLFSGESELSKHFLANIRTYNAALSFASTHCPNLQTNNQRPGVHFYRVSGQIYHNIVYSFNGEHLYKNNFSI